MEISLLFIERQSPKFNSPHCWKALSWFWIFFFHHFIYFLMCLPTCRKMNILLCWNSSVDIFRLLWCPLIKDVCKPPTFDYFISMFFLDITICLRNWLHLMMALTIKRQKYSFPVMWKQIRWSKHTAMSGHTWIDITAFPAAIKSQSSLHIYYMSISRTLLAFDAFLFLLLKFSLDRLERIQNSYLFWSSHFWTYFIFRFKSFFPLCAVSLSLSQHFPVYLTVSLMCFLFPLAECKWICQI